MEVCQWCSENSGLPNQDLPKAILVCKTPVSLKRGGRSGYWHLCALCGVAEPFKRMKKKPLKPLKPLTIIKLAWNRIHRQVN